MKTPHRVLLPLLALGLVAAPGFAQQEDPKPESVPAIPLVKPAAAGPASGGMILATPTVNPAATQTQGTTTQDTGGYAALEVEYATAYREWVMKIQELRGTGTEYPPQPNAAFYARFRALADQGNVDARLWCLENFDAGDDTPAEFRAEVWKGEAYSLATAARSNAALALRAHRAMFGGVAVDGVGEAWVGHVLDYMMVTAVDDSVAASILASRASNADYSDDAATRSKAAGYYAQLLERYPDSKEAARAKGKLFSAQNLKVGMVAPDFSGKSVDGETINLYDYRGKVVLIDFWGFW